MKLLYYIIPVMHLFGQLFSYDLDTTPRNFEFNFVHIVPEKFVGLNAFQVIDGDCAKLITPELIGDNALKNFLDNSKIIQPEESEWPDIEKTILKFDKMVKVEIGKDKSMIGMVFYLNDEHFGILTVYDNKLKCHSFVLRISPESSKVPNTK